MPQIIETRYVEAPMEVIRFSIYSGNNFQVDGPLFAQKIEETLQEVASDGYELIQIKMVNSSTFTTNGYNEHTAGALLSLKKIS